MKKRTALLLWLDCSMLLAVVLLECLSLTGLQLHEWLGFVLCPLVLLHVVLQWQWFITQFQRMLTAEAWRIRVNAGLNLLLLIVMAAVLVSGVLVSNQSIATLGERFGRLRLWSEIHGDLNFILVVLVGLHLALNWVWIAAALRGSRTKRPGIMDAALSSRSLSPRERAGVRGKVLSTSPSFTSHLAASSHRPFMRWLGRATAVLAVSFIAAGGIYFALAGITPRPHEQRNSGAAPTFKPQGRGQSFSDGMRELSVTTATVALAALVGRYLFRLRL